MKFDIMDFYSKSLHQEHYAHKTDYIRHNLEEKYGILLNINNRTLFLYNNVLDWCFCVSFIFTCR